MKNKQPELVALVTASKELRHVIEDGHFIDHHKQRLTSTPEWKDFSAALADFKLRPPMANPTPNELITAREKLEQEIA